MKSIYTLVPDIQELLKRKDGWFSEQLAHEFSTDIARVVGEQFNKRETRPTLRLSGMGDKCPKALWHSIHTPELAEPLPAWAEFKFAYGDIAESLAKTLAKAAGHTVTGEQDELVVDGIVGHRDCVIDGCVVDIKSASSRGFIKFKDGSLAGNDSFGYLFQLDGYLLGSSSDPLVSVKNKGYILAIDKTLGHMVLYEHELRSEDIRLRIAEYKAIVGRSDPPDCTCEVIEQGRSGNLGLGVRASYSAFKHCCFPHLRTFLYASGPQYLTKVVRLPDVKEINKHGQTVYN